MKDCLCLERPFLDLVLQTPLPRPGCRKRGVEFKGGSLHDGFGGFGGSEKLLALLLLVLQIIITVPQRQP